MALRAFANQPAFVATILLTLGLAIGGNVAMFAVLDASLFRALPYADPGRLVMGRVTYDGDLGNTVSAPDYLDVRDRAASFSSLAAFTPFSIEATVTGGGAPERVRAPYASWNLFRTLGVEPAAGRSFRPAEEGPGGADVVVLSWGYWQARFAGDPGVVGSAINLDGAPVTVVGVLPESFRFSLGADVWRLLVRGGDWAQARQFHNWVLIGRLAGGVDLAAAQAEVDAVSARLAELYPESNENKGMYFVPLHDALVAGYRGALGLLTASVVVLLLVACANVAGILLARGSARRSEMALRSVLGAGRARLVRQLMVENVVLTAGAAVVGLVLAGFLQCAILGFVSLDRLGGVAARLSPTTLAAAIGLALTTVALFGLLPALRASRTEPARELAGGGARSGSSRDATRFRNALVVGQVALTAVLLLLSGLLLRSFTRLGGVDPGFRTDHLLTAEVPLPPAKYADPSTRPPFLDEVQRRIAALPGVEAVGMASHLPLRDAGNDVRVAPIERWGDQGAFDGTAYQRMVLPGYFAAVGVPLLAGRDVETADRRDTQHVVVLSGMLAGRLFPDGGAPLGRTVGIDVGGEQPYAAEVVGVVGDVVPTSLVAGKQGVMYFPYGQRAPSTMRVAVRTRGEPAEVTGRIREILGALDPDVPLSGVATMDDVLARSLAERRALLLVLGAFAVVAALLATVGLYGVLAYRVARRVREIGVRMALGATVASVSRDVLLGGLRLVLLGLALGLPASWFASRLVRGMLYQVGTADPLTYVAVSVFFGTVAAAACLLPARRAAKVDPARAFHAE
jgi:putative ABC transport system permease protein